MIALLFSIAPASAGDIKWEGTYRFEALKLFDPNMNGGTNKSYILHHLTLKPTITAYDGLTIHSRFDILNNSNYPNDQLGQTFGSGVNTRNPISAGTNMSDANAISDQQRAELIAVNEIYANWVHEFGVLTVGRAPMHFGLGMTFNGGFGMFDHWLENRDMIAYKVVMGNFSAMPVLAKTYEGILDQEDDVNDFILQINYENPETELEVGVIYQARRSTANVNSNDTPPAAVGAPTGTLVGNYEVNSYNIFVSQWVDAVKVAFELGFASGNTGIGVGGTEIKQDGFGGAVKVSWTPETSKWGALLDLGFASGDDPNTPGTYEGYTFDQNYDIAFILFNHPVGRADLFRSSYVRNTAVDASTAFDTEAISNTMFASAAGLYKITDKFKLETRLTYAQLSAEPLQRNVDKNVGLELDLTLKYEPFKGFQWINRGGVLFPGAAFEGGTNNFPVHNSYGFETKAAISF